MKIAEIIAEQPAWVSPETTVFDAARTMKLRDVGMLPVCDRDRLVGTITDRDITIRVVANGWDCQRTLIGDVMSEDAIFCYDNQEAEEIAQLMHDHQVRRLPVLNCEKRLVGIVSLGDLATRHGNEEMAGAVLGRIAAGPVLVD